MARGDKNPLAEVENPVEPVAEANAETQEGGEIDRIMQEIEDLEKKMDNGSDMSNNAESGKVVSLHSTSLATAESLDTSESLAETDAVPAADEPLLGQNEFPAGDGGLSLKIGGCAEVALEFSRAGVTVTLTCSQENLTITTDQGAEFKIPFNRAA